MFELKTRGMHPRVQELLKLRDKLPRQELIQKLPEELRKLQEKGAGKVSGPLTPEEKEANRMCLLKEFLPEKYEEELREKKG